MIIVRAIISASIYLELAIGCLFFNIPNLQEKYQQPSYQENSPHWEYDTDGCQQDYYGNILCDQEVI